MQFTQASLEKLVCQAFFGRDTDKSVIPMQGNFSNPQDSPWLTREMLDGSVGKPQTWIGFEKQDSDPRTMPFVVEHSDAYSLVWKMSRCRLQIVGKESEDWAESVAHWNLRDDVAGVLSTLDATLLADGLGKIVTSPYIQDGLNIVWAYNVYFNVLWASSIDLTAGDYWKTAVISGEAI